MPIFVVTSADSPDNTPKKAQQWPGPRKDWLMPGEVFAFLHPASDTVLSRGVGLVELQHQLLGITFDGHRLFPAFQFDARGRVRPGAHELAQAIAGRLQTPRDVEAVILWLFSEQDALEGARPCDRFATKPQQVIDAACKRFASRQSARTKTATKSRSKAKRRPT